MSAPMFPFAALVGLESLKLALQLAAIDSRLSVLVRGDKGAGKSTAARGLGQLLAEGAPFVNLPIGATEDRLLGGLDIERTMKGEPALKPGLLTQADGGVLYIDEVNLFPDHLADALLDAVASGTHVVEREGFSVTQPARFVLVGSMNPEEGTLRPQLLDRFALAVDVSAPVDVVQRRQVVERRLHYDNDPAAFVGEWRQEQEALKCQLHDARANLAQVTCPGDTLSLISDTICRRGVRSLRADLAVVRASLALAALEGAAEVTPVHIDTVLPFALYHRAPRSRENPSVPTSRCTPPEPPSDPRPDASSREPERVFSPSDVAAPRLVVQGASSEMRGGMSGPADARPGLAIHSRLAEQPRELDLRPTVVHAIGRTGATQIHREDLHEKVRAPSVRLRFVFVVDSSGSHAAHQRMRLVKGAVNGLLNTSTGCRDEVAIIVFRGAAATVILEPTNNVDEAHRALEYLPTGGRTPMAHALELAAGYVTDAAVLILITDGRANVPSRGDDPWADALHAATAIQCPVLVIDSEVGPPITGGARQLADAIGAECIALEGLDGSGVVQLLRDRVRPL